MPGGRNENVVFTAVVSAIAAVAAVPIALVIALSGGGTTVVVAAIFALIPVGPLIGCYLWLDRYEPEPRSLLVTGLAWGAFVATLLALVLPREPLQIAFRSLQTDDRQLRGTALEYLDGILPPAIRERLWPFLEAAPARRSTRPREEVMAELLRSHRSIIVNLEALSQRGRPAPAAP